MYTLHIFVPASVQLFPQAKDKQCFIGAHKKNKRVGA